MTTLFWLAICICGLLILGVLTIVITYTRTTNYLVALDQRCETAFADIDVHLKHRSNLIPGLVSVVKSLATHEKDLILGVTEARSKALAASPTMKLQAEGNLSAQIGALLSAAENNPEIRALPEFAQLRQQLIDCENRITAARRFHNLAIEEYNTALRQFPGILIAQRHRMTSRPLYDLGVERVLLDEPVRIAI